MKDIRTLVRMHRSKAGLSPGTLMHVEAVREEDVAITRFDYGPDFLREATFASIGECLALRNDRPAVTWINIDGLHQIENVKVIGSQFDIDSLSLEDIVTAAQRPKLEDFGRYLLIIASILSPETEGDRIRAEQISIVVGAGYVLSFQESRGDVFTSLRDRIRHGKGRIRRMGADYLAYALLDSIVDHYFVLLERFGERVEELEEELAGDPRPETLRSIHELRREIIFLKRSVWPLREVIHELERCESDLVGDHLHRYLRDLHDHTIQVVDIVETLHDLLSGMLDLYVSSVSNKMNEVMKVLTVFASIFIPLTFIAGVYGMNFEYMPELSWRWSYPLLLLAMAAGASGMLLYFRRKGWI